MDTWWQGILAIALLWLLLRLVGLALALVAELRRWLFSIVALLIVAGVIVEVLARR